MRFSIVLKTLVAFSFIFLSSVAYAEGSIGDGATSIYNSLTCTKPGDVGQGLNLQDKWKAAAQQYQTAYSLCAADTSRLQAFKAASEKYLTNQKACVEKNHSAGKNCLEKCSENIQKMVSASQLILAGLSQSSIVDTCSKMGQLMNIAQTAMTAFSATCGAQKFLCDSSCSSAVSSLSAAKEFLEQPVALKENAASGCLESPKNTLQNIAIQELIPESKLSIAGKKLECSGYAVNLSAAAAGILSAVQRAKAANACEEASKGDQVAGAAEKCSVPENKDLPECICKANPRSPGCSLAADIPQNHPGGFGQPVGGGATTTGLVGGTSGFNSDSGSDLKTTTNGPNGASAPVGGGGGSAALGSGTIGSNDGLGSGKVENKMNTGIYGGEGGGGGGAFGSRGGAGSTGAQGLNSGLRDKISAEREIASLRSQVSSQGGKSNWEKVKDRYVQEKTNLIGR